MSKGRSNVWKLRSIVNVLDPEWGARGDGVTDDLASIQDAIDAYENIFMPWTAAGYRITGTITVKGDMLGEGVLGSQTRIEPSTDTFPILVNDPTRDRSRFKIANLDLDYQTALGSGTGISSNANASAIKFRTTSGHFPYEYIIENVIARGAYVGYDDTSLSYMATLRQLRMDYCRTGFVKNLGTTFHFENCFASHCKKSWSINGCVSTTLTACAADQVIQDGTFAHCSEFLNCHGLTINGFDTEGNVLNQSFATLMKFESCAGFSLRGFRTFGNVWSPPGGSENYGIQVTTAPCFGTIEASSIGPTNSDSSTGTGAVYTAVVGAGCLVNLRSTRLEDMTGTVGTKRCLFNSGTVYGSGNDLDTVVPGIFINQDNIDVPGTSTDNGDNGATLTVGASKKVQIWNTPLAGARAAALSTAGAFDGATFHIVRTAAATGASALNVGTGPLKAVALGQWCDVVYNGNTGAWMLARFGSL